MLVYTPQLTPRVAYACNLLLHQVIGAEIPRFTTDAETFAKADGIKINYGGPSTLGGVHIAPAGLLTETGIKPQKINVTTYHNVPVFFQTNTGTLPFDVFAAAFFLATRYEEYLPFKADAHQRFTAPESLAYRNNFLELPVVNIWANWLAQAITAHFPKFKPQTKPYSFIPTIDIDNLFAYRGKGAKRFLGAALRDVAKGNLKEFRHRVGAVARIKPDPFNTFEHQQAMHAAHGLSSIYFMLFSAFGPNDRNVRMSSLAGRKRLRQIAKASTVAIHPSYQSNADVAIVKHEKEALSQAIRKPITQSRQHYLKLNMPQTFRNLVNLGITDDYTMGYADMPGFRAGMATPFTFYDVKAEQELPLTLHPFMLMDVTFIDYFRISPQMALPRMKRLVDATRAVNGQLITVFHNRIFSEKEPEWRGWITLYNELLSYAKP